MARTYFLESTGSNFFWLYTNIKGARGKREYVTKAACGGTVKRTFTAHEAVEYATNQGGAVKLFRLAQAA